MSRALRVTSLVAFALGPLLWYPSPARGSLQHESHHSWPISLDSVTVTGTVIVDDTLPHSMYFLDVNGDGVAEYLLAFGPWWYEPPSGAVLPSAGAAITVVGAVQDSTPLPALIVFELDGMTWREPVEYGMHGWNGEPSWTFQGDTLTVTGTAMVDTTYFYDHYYLDTDGDTIPEYQLGFGPAWYESASGAARPSDGDEIKVWGITHERDGLTLLAVYVINEMEWRPFVAPAPWAGRWIHRDHAGTLYAYCVNDTTNRLGFPFGHMGHGMGGNWPDSAFAQFWRVPPDSMPGPRDPERFMGFYLNVHDPGGQSMMNGQFGGQQHMMQFENELQFRFHFYDEDLERHGLSIEGMKVRYWDEETQTWTDVQSIDVDTETNTVTFGTGDLRSYYAILAPAVSTAREGASPEAGPSTFVLHQNHPNPFYRVTTITYDLSAARRAALRVYDVSGRLVATLVDEGQPAGRHRITFDGSGLPSGVYFYRLGGDGQHSTARPMTLVR